MRWNHPQLGRLMPADFIAAGRGGRASSAPRRLGAAPRRRRPRRQLDHGLGQRVRPPARRRHAAALVAGRAPRDRASPPARLLLELTESTLASAGAGAETELAAIHALGVADRARRLRVRLLLARVPRPAADRRPEDRPLAGRARRRRAAAPGGDARHRATSPRSSALETIVEGIEREEQRATLLGWASAARRATCSRRRCRSRRRPSIPRGRRLPIRRPVPVTRRPPDALTRRAPAAPRTSPRRPPPRRCARTRRPRSRRRGGGARWHADS